MYPRSPLSIHRHLFHCKPRTKGTLAAGFVAAALLAGCAHVPVLSLPALAAIDIETTRFDVLRAAVEMPRVLEPGPDGVRLNVKLTIEGELAEERSYALLHQSAKSLVRHLPDAGPDRHTFVYALSEEDQRGMTAIRQAVETAKAQDQRGSLAVNIEVSDLCTRGVLPEGRLLVDVFLYTSETERFIRTIDGYDLREISGGDLSDPQTLARCP